MSKTLLPGNYLQKEKTLDLLGAEILGKFSGMLDEVETLFDPQHCSEQFLPVLAQMYQVDFWDDGLSAQDKRNLISNSLALKKHKGTAWAITQTFEVLGLQAAIEEWFDYGGDSFHFRIVVESVGVIITADDLLRLEEMVNKYKNARSILDAIQVQASIEPAVMYLAGAAQSIEIIELELT